MHKPNVTVAAIVSYKNKFLLVKERDKFTQRICYNQPAGHLEKDETLIDAAQRELFEETGLILQATSLLGIYNFHAPNGVHYLRFCFNFLLTTEPKFTSPQDQDIISADWFSLDEIQHLPLRSPLVLKCIEDSLIKPHISLDFITD
ncbi:NUDIX hydrolase [Pseudoalteromonas sp. MMG010]|uniref:NUDIX hydrolase n=1 Tax=Pseudoalteromonas sp. MMG010 TaxID=2822685 RepID=UPI001B3A79DB|nr:NUDIX hydrolase [Pseudoalteromonas sp. MMG010]MBQ4832477.1 NUDIX hydrolase [Pseudoalteromonas sp. MMG010]